MEIVKDVVRMDNYSLANPIITEQGFLRCDAVCVARAGTIDYEVLPDGTPGIRTDFIAADELGDPSSINTLKMLPMVNGHPKDLPKGFIDATTAKQRQIGHVGENIHLDSDKLFSSIMITDAQAIDDYKKGKRGLSLAYMADLIVENGVHGGKSYQYRQTNRRYNHLALCNVGRAGDVARIPGLANLDGIEVPQPIQKRSTDMVIINIDGIDYKDQAPEVKRHIESLQKTIETLTAEKNASTTNLDAVTGKLDTANAKISDLEKQITDLPGKINDGVNARSALVTLVTPHLDEKTLKDIGTLTDIQLKKAVAKKAFPKMAEKIDAGTEAYLAPVFDSALEVLSVENHDAADAAARVAANGGASQKTANQDSTPQSEDEARDAMIKRNSGLYKGEQKK